MTYHRYTPEQKRWLELNYKKYGKTTPVKFNAKFNLALSESAVESQVYRMGLHGQEDPERFTVKEVAQALGCGENNVREKIRRGTIQAKRVLKTYLIEPEEFERIISAHWTNPPWPAVSSIQVQKRFGYTHQNLSLLVQAGAITGVLCQMSPKSKKILMLKRDEIERGERYLKETGFNRVPWAALKVQAERKQA